MSRTVPGPRKLRWNISGRSSTSTCRRGSNTSGSTTAPTGPRLRGSSVSLRPGTTCQAYWPRFNPFSETRWGPISSESSFQRRSRNSTVGAQAPGWMKTGNTTRTQRKKESPIKRSVAVFLIALVLFSAFQATVRVELAKAETQPIWPMEGYDARHTGQSPYDTLENNGNLEWKFKTGEKIWSSLAIGSD